MPATNKIDDVYLRSDERGYYLQVLGQGGEARSRQFLLIALTNELTPTVTSLPLQTNENGLIFLGKLERITSLTVKNTALSIDSKFTFNPRASSSILSFPATRGQQGQPIYIPYTGKHKSVSDSAFGLLLADAVGFKDDLTATALNVQNDITSSCRLLFLLAITSCY